MGRILGYASGVVHHLDHRSEWGQFGEEKEYVHQERPGCWVGRGDGPPWIDVDGTSWLGKVGRYIEKLRPTPEPSEKQKFVRPMIGWRLLFNLVAGGTDVGRKNIERG